MQIRGIRRVLVSAAVLLCVLGVTQGPSARPSACGWQATTVPASPDVALEGVASLSASEAWAGGWTSARSVILRWDGGDWNQMAVPKGTTYDELLAVSASSAR